MKAEQSAYTIISLILVVALFYFFYFEYERPSDNITRYSVEYECDLKGGQLVWIESSDPTLFGSMTYHYQRCVLNPVIQEQCIDTLLNEEKDK